MKKIALPLVLVSLSLSACTMPWSHKDNSESVKNTTTKTSVNKKDQVVHTINYTLKDGDKLVDSKSNFPFVVGKRMPFIASGMDELVATMKVGEKKSIKIAAEKLYGPSTLSSTGNLEQFVDTFTTTGSIDMYGDRITTSLPKAQVLKDGKPEFKVGDEVQVMWVIGMIPGGLAKVEKIEGDMVTVSAENRMNPFTGKKIQVGTEWNGGNNQTLRIEKIEGKVVTIKHTNPSDHAFAGVDVKVGAEWTDKQNKKYQITAIDGNRVGYTFTPHQLGGKELTLEVEVLSIK